jgi:hypothetical protein
VSAGDTDRELLLAAIFAVGGIRPKEAFQVLEHLSASDDSDIAETATSNPGELDEGQDEGNELLGDDEPPRLPR